MIYKIGLQPELTKLSVVLLIIIFYTVTLHYLERLLHLKYLNFGLSNFVEKSLMKLGLRKKETLDDADKKIIEELTKNG